MKFEHLPNELILDLFELFDLVDLFRAFLNLNARLNQLLLGHHHKHHLDLRSTSKHDAQTICRVYLPTAAKQLVSLHLSDDEATPACSDLLFSDAFALLQCNHLESLSLYHIHSFQRMYDITSQCQHMPSLRRLSLIRCNFWHDEKDFQYFIDTIWSLPKLTHCTLDYTVPGHRLLTQLSHVSQSIRYLSMKNIHCNFRTLSHLLDHTPHLRQLQTTVFCGCRDEQLQSNASSIVALNIIQKSSLNTMISLLHSMTSLRDLTLETNYIYLNGFEWRKLLTEHVPNVERFRLRMFFELSALRSRVEQVDLLLDSFRTPFWTRQRRWFVQCDWTTSKTQKHAVLYTLPYAFPQFLYDNLCQSKCTGPHHPSYRSYHCVKRFQYLEYENSFLIPPVTTCSIQCSAVQHLEVRLPFNDKLFYSIVPTLCHLTSLDVVLSNRFAYYQLQTLLDRAPRLYSLTFRCLQNIPSALFRLTSGSLRRLDFISTSTLRCGHFKKFECDELAESPLGQLCQVLLIKVQNRANILHLVRLMVCLRSLVVQCEDEDPQSDELLTWLHEHLPPMCSSERDHEDRTRVRLWIR